jgi:hypothetical protein
MAASGALIETPHHLSEDGLGDDHVNGIVQPVDFLNAYSANRISGVPYPPTPSQQNIRRSKSFLPMGFEHVALDAPVVDKARPLFPADETNIIPCFSTISVNNC